MKVAAIVPSLNPDEQLPRVVAGLVEAGFTRIIVINDGSEEAHRPYFDQVARQPGCVVLEHPVNYGKGHALKTAFAHHLENPEDYIGVVTLDADGQHHTEDVVRCAQELERHPDALVLGTRDFSQSHVPLHNALGNRITSLVFLIFCGLSIRDTQTGLRAIPNRFAETLVDVKGERYEFETNMLLETKRAGVKLISIPISTIYMPGEGVSHFRVFHDSFRIYLLIMAFGLSSLVSFFVDIGLFALLNYLLSPLNASLRLLVSTVGARVCSAIFNFTLNRNLVFQSKTRAGASFFRYVLLCVAQMLCSYGGVYLLAEIVGMPTLLSKILVDGLLFFASFFIQKRWVFKDSAA